MDVEGKQVADVHAKEAAQSTVSVPERLPHFLRSELPIIVSALKAERNKSSPSRWLPNGLPLPALFELLS